MGDIALGMEFDMLKHGQKPPAVKQLQSTINVVAVGGTIPWLAPLVMDIPGVMPLINPFRRLCHLLLEERRQVCRVYAVSGTELTIPFADCVQR